MSTVSGESVEDLVLRIQCGDAAGMGELYEKLRRFIASICRRYRWRCEMEDLMQESYFALAAAVDGYNPEQGAKFTSYFAYWINERLQRYIDSGGLSYRARERVRKYNAICSGYRAEYGEDPSLRQVADRMGLDVEQVEQVRADAELRTVSLDAPISDENMDSPIGDLIPSPENLEDFVIETLDNESLKGSLWRAVDDLPGTAPEIMRSYYQGGKSIPEISDEMGLPLYKVRYAREKSLQDLRRDRQLLPYLRELSDIYSGGLRGGGLTRYRETGESSTERIAIRLSEREARRERGRQ